MNNNIPPFNQSVSSFMAAGNANSGASAAQSQAAGGNLMGAGGLAGQVGHMGQTSAPQVHSAFQDADMSGGGASAGTNGNIGI